MSGLTKRDLDSAGCQTPGCDHENEVCLIRSKCHPETATWVCYTPGGDELVLRCAEPGCGRAAVAVQVAAGAASSPPSVTQADRDYMGLLGMVVVHTLRGDVTTRDEWVMRLRDFAEETPADDLSRNLDMAQRLDLFETALVALRQELRL